MEWRRGDVREQTADMQSKFSEYKVFKVLFRISAGKIQLIINETEYTHLRHF
jgi:hypothetical protein